MDALTALVLPREGRGNPDGGVRRVRKGIETGYAFEQFEEKIGIKNRVYNNKSGL